MITETDEQLIVKSLRGDRGATQTLVSRHRSAVTRWAFHALGNADDAQDVAQEALMYAVAHLQDLREHSRISAWLRSIVASSVFDYRRRRGTRRLGEPIDLLNEAAEESRYLESIDIQRALSGLSHEHRATLIYHYYGGWSIAETADLLGVPQNTVRSRLLAAKRKLAASLQISVYQKDNMQTSTLSLTSPQLALIAAAFPGAKVLTVENDPEAWMPFSPRVTLTLANGDKRVVDFRSDITPDRVALHGTLTELGLPLQRIVAGPVPDGDGRWLTMCERARGQNLLLWTLGGTPHRIRVATDLTFQSIQSLQSLTDRLSAAGPGAALPRRTLLNEIEAVEDETQWSAERWMTEGSGDRAGWLRSPWFANAVARAKTAAADIDVPLVYTHYGHFFPLSYRIPDGDGLLADGLTPPLVEVVNPWGHLGDPIVGLAMVWVYDCYPFVHTGFVEQYLWRKQISRREFAPRLLITALRMIARDLPLERPDGDSTHWDNLHKWAEMGLNWL